MYSRRKFFSRASMGSLLWPLARHYESPQNTFEAISPPTRTSDQVARDEEYWRAVQQAFSVDRSLIHLNNGGVCPTPQCVQQSRETHQNYAYKVPFYVHRRTLKPQLERVRKYLADTFGASQEEIAITRNTSEGMEICQLGIDLERGDEILTTEHDYPRMINTWKQRERREGIVLKQLPLPVPAESNEAIVDLFRQHITSRTRVIMICHMIDLTGQIMPVRDIITLAKKHNIEVIVDGAQAFGQLDFTNEELGCDYYATSLHKWLMGPPGTGFLFVRRNKINDIWPLMPAGLDLKNDIRKFEDVGTQSLSRFLALSDALTFHHTIGVVNKIARLRYLRNLWLDELIDYDRLHLHTSLKPEFAAGLATISIDGIDNTALRDYLWQTHRVIVRPINHPAVQGIRISPGLQTTPNELSQFVDIIRQVVKFGIPT